MKEEEYEELTSQEFLNAKQLTILSVIVLLVIQTLPLIISPTPFTEWMLLGYTAGVSTCAIVGAILVQHNADKITKLYKQAFNKDFYMTIETINEIRQEYEREVELKESLPEILDLLKAWAKAQANPLEPPTKEDLGIKQPTPYDSEDELFS
tara:strand:- start:389 stop:844 length:456 start_codon:yes stop_codon:yes gene_type:complete